MNLFTCHHSENGRTMTSTEKKKKWISCCHSLVFNNRKSTSHNLYFPSSSLFLNTTVM